MRDPFTIPYLRRLLNRFNATALMVLLALSAFAQIPKFNSNRPAPATVYLDFDGQVVQGTAWNWDSTIHAKPSGLSEVAITEIFNRVQEDFRIFNINITTDSSVYAKAPKAKRIRIIVTPTSHWYGRAGGISFVGSFTWGDGTPAWVFTDVLQNNPKYIGEACSHETGHTLGLQHQSTYNKACKLIHEYAEGKGDGEIGWAPIMGVSYYKNVTTWTVGTNIEGCSVIQNDINTISKGSNNIGFRADDHGNTMRTATPIPFYGGSFQSSGIINNGPDVDVFKFTLAKSALFKTTAIPGHIGKGNAGANMDIKISLVKSNGDTIGRYNPPTSLSASIDTSLGPGTYYLVIDGVANQNMTDYNSAGYYTLTGKVEAAPRATKLSLKGSIENNAHLISWNFESDKPVRTTIIEGSPNGVDFKTIATVSPAITTYKNTFSANGSMFYRVQMLAGQDDTPYYSNIISLSHAVEQKVSLLGNIIRNSALINVSGNYTYDLMDETGRFYQRGKLSDGYNQIIINNTKKGLMLLRVYNNNEQLVFKLIKQ